MMKKGDLKPKILVNVLFIINKDNCNKKSLYYDVNSADV